MVDGEADRDRNEPAVLSYQSGLTQAPPPTLTQAVLLSLPGFMFGLFTIADVAGLLHGFVGSCQMLLLWLFAIASSLVSLREYRGLRPKPWYVWSCLSVSACVIAITLLLAAVLALAQVQDW